MSEEVEELEAVPVDDVFVRRLTAPMLKVREPLILGLLKVAYSDTYNDTVGASTMTDLYAGRLQAWEVVGKVKDETKFMGMFTTSITSGRRYGRRSLYVETLSAYSRITQSAWKKAIQVLTDYAKRNGCAIIEADVMNEKVARQAERLGFRTASVRLVKEL